MGIDQKVIDVVLNKGQFYYHCCISGKIYLDKEFTVPLIDLKEMTGETCIPSNHFGDYHISTGISPQCYEKYMQNQRDEIKIAKQRWKNDD